MPAATLFLLMGEGGTPVALNTHVFTLLNRGSADLHVGTLELEPINGSTAFQITSDGTSGRTLGPNETSQFRVQFTPLTEGPHACLVHIPSDDPDGRLTISVTGNGLDPVDIIPVVRVDPTTWSYGSVNISGGTGVKMFSVSNIGTGPMVVGTITTTGAAFAKSADTASGATIAPGASKSFTMSFDPSATGPASGSASVPSNGGATVVVSLSGTGIASVPPPVPVGRFYFTRNAAAVLAIVNDSAWQQRDADIDYSLGTSKSGPAVAWGDTLTHTGASGSRVRLCRFVSRPLAAQVVSTAFRCYAIGYRGNALGGNVTSAIRFGIWRSGPGTVEWQSVLSAASAESPWGDSANPVVRRFPSGADWSRSVSLTLSAGDRLIVELGARVFTGADGALRLRWGGASSATDIDEAQGEQDLALAPWIDFAEPLLVIA